MRLTQRGRIVRGIVIAIVIYIVLAWILNATLPPECQNQSFNDMSEWCQNIAKL